MATGGDDPDAKNETTIDVAGFMRAFDADDDDNEGNVSMFCKACLHPYRGEQKSGTIVLKCERCGQTDTILEQEVGSLDPQEWIGNLMMNRFMQVVKDQSDLGTSLLDPNFADDDFKRVHLALTEYTYRLDKLAQRLYDFSFNNGYLTLEDHEELESWLKKCDGITKFLDMKPIKATRVIMMLHDILSARINLIRDEAENGASNVPSSANKKSKRKGNKRKNKPPQESDPETLIAEINAELDLLGPAILNLVEGIIVKHGLSENTMYNVQRRIIASGQTDGQVPEHIQRAMELSLAEETKKQEEADKAEEDSKSPEEADKAEDESKSPEEAEKDSNKEAATGDSTDLSLTEEEKQYFEEVGTETEGASEQLGLKSKYINKEAIETIEKKFMIKFGVDDGESDSTNQWNKFAEEDQAREIAKAEGADPGEDELEVDAVVPHEDFNPGEHIKMNIYALSQEFIREMHQLKQDKFRERKDQALLDLHERVVRVKREMENVEKMVVEELNTAYDRKKKKIENQCQQIDEKQEQLHEAERLMVHYARTGQQDKLEELMRQINLHNEKN